MRFGAFERKCNGLRDRWFVFDSFLVSTMVFETWLMTSIMLMMSNGNSGLGNTGILRMARLLRLTRMARMARLLRAMPELLILIKGMIAAMRSVSFTLGLLFVMLYIFAIAFVQLCDGSECQVFFPDVPSAMHELLLNAALMDGLANLVLPLKEQSLILLLVLYAFIFLSALTIMNMLIGVICEVVSAVAATERESLSLAFVREKMQELLEESGADEDNDHMISKEEFTRLIVNPKAIAILEDVGVDVMGLVDVQDTLFEGEGGLEEGDEAASEKEEKKLTVSDLMGLVLDLRGGNTATVRDIVNLRKYLNIRFSSLEQKLTRISRGSQLSHAGSMHSLQPSRPNSAAHGARNSGLEDQDAESTPDSVSAKPGSTPRFLDMFHSLRGLMSAHEVEVAAVAAENRQLKEQLAQLTTNAFRSSLSEANALCTEVDAENPIKALSIPPASKGSSSIPSPKEPAIELRTKSPVAHRSDLRTASDASAAGSVGHSNAIGATNTAASPGHAFGTSGVFSSQHSLASQQAPPQSTNASCTVAR